MKLIEPNVELWQQGYKLDEIWNHIAKCMRVCYQSEKKKMNESEEDFVKRVVFRGHSYEEIAKDRKLQETLHLSVLEHGTIYLYIKGFDKYDRALSAVRYTVNKYSKATINTDIAYITTNMRVLIENGWMDDLQYLCEPTEYHEKRYTFCLYTNVGGIRDINRHRVQSISEESTRYCAYSKDKFDNQLQIAKLPYISDEEYKLAEFHQEDLFKNNVIHGHNTSKWNAVDWYIWYIQMGDYVYNNLNRLGWSAEKCSNVLTFSTKTQSVHTAFESDWRHYCDLRSDQVSGKVRPEVKVIADKIKSILNTK